MPTLTLQQLQKHWPHGDKSVPGLMEGIAKSAPAVFTKYNITTSLTLAIIMGQFSEETGGGIDMVEDIRYTPQRALQLWPTHFSSVNDLYHKIGSYVGDAQFDIKLMDSVYGDRMGNRPGTHDGSIYIGRGLSQCTGRDGYRNVSIKTGLNVIDHPEILSAPDTALECGVADFVLCGCMPFAEKGDVVNVTKHLNGGLNGLAERERWTAIWKQELGL